MGNAYDNASLIVTPNAYKASKIYSLKPDDGSGDLSFSRAGSKMVRNSAGLWETIGTNIPPLHYPVGGGCPSWLFEAEAENNALHSTDFSNAVWAVAGTAAKAASALSTNIVGVTPYDISGLGSQSTNYFEQSVGGFAGVSFQVFIKATVIGDVGLTINLTSNNAIDTNITLTEEWQEFSVYNAGSNGSPRLSAGTATRCTISYIGVVNSSVATSPIITAGSSVTRLRDVPLSIATPLLLNDFSIYMEFNLSKINQGVGFMLFGSIDSAAVSRIYIDNAATMTFDVGASYTSIGSSGLAINTDYKICFTRSGTTLKYYINGSLISTWTVPADIFKLTSFANAVDGGGDTSKYISLGLFKPSIAYLTALSTTEAIELTTL